ncbi:MAG: alcohol dehydrogenase [Chloroflexi bacterium]|nr:MAG: alcohol dehydrogenase [Anaerolineaceae bacterium 4572_32.2]RLC78443.1 MAG: alcohol dehydrogenase [Chloroflexota bacterium]RLC80864.1 MAG: alcohol dehydrogenase [Chloroflexota bacterium]HEY73360.1 alcohol dehydrogenase catalytic domain-containing protein [Thermoflexia bacterium]
MRALLLDQELKLVENYPTPEPPPGEALVRVSVTGVCNTDLELVKGYMQFRGVPGHEFVGVVEQAPSAEEADTKHPLEGHRVVGEINAACGACPTCQASRPTHCPHRTTLGIEGRDGAFAEYLTLPIRNLHPVPDSLSDEVAVFAEPLAAACEILEQVHVRPTDRVVVLGDGKLGLLCAQVLALTGCDLTAVGHHQAKLDILARRGIHTALDEKSVGGGADIVVETTGNPGGYTAARRLVRPRGVIVLKSTYHGPVDADLSMVVVDEITLVGSRCGPFGPALRLLERGLVEVTSLIQARYPLSQAITAFEYASRPGTLKVLIDCHTTN